MQTASRQRAISQLSRFRLYPSPPPLSYVKEIHNLVPSAMNEGIKAGIVELVDSKNVALKFLSLIILYDIWKQKPSPNNCSLSLSLFLCFPPKTHQYLPTKHCCN
ncbi:hypothetical protein L6452_03160 [Arctium lappa]|uniref:Uncharacterized protein n=1 Tax=Arctium lappa TaxID=4217 RepID=A0ACB9FN22_ARCLA|nr:hypothetical protein L6452_03160 [Arctium lappa]